MARGTLLMAAVLIMITALPILVSGCTTGDPAEAAAPFVPTGTASQPSPGPGEEDTAPVVTASPIDGGPKATPGASPYPQKKGQDEQASQSSTPMFLFIFIPGIPGGVAEPQHTDWIQVLSYSFQVDGLISPYGLGDGRPTFGEFVMVKAVDKSSPKLALFGCSGSHILEAVLEICQEGEAGLEPLMRYRLPDVVVVRVNAEVYTRERYEHLEEVSLWVNPEPPNPALDHVPIEEVTFNCRAIEWTYFTGAEGPGGEVTAGWDLAQNQPL